MTDPTDRELIEQLANALQDHRDREYGWQQDQHPEKDLLAKARARLATPEPAAGPTEPEVEVEPT